MSNANTKTHADTVAVAATDAAITKKSSEKRICTVQSSKNNSSIMPIPASIILDNILPLCGDDRVTCNNLSQTSKENYTTIQSYFSDKMPWPTNVTLKCMSDDDDDDGYYRPRIIDVASSGRRGHEGYIAATDSCEIMFWNCQTGKRTISNFVRSAKKLYFSPTCPHILISTHRLRSVNSHRLRSVLSDLYVWDLQTNP